jgi:hypothetical protein
MNLKKLADIQVAKDGIVEVEIFLPQEALKELEKAMISIGQRLDNADYHRGLEKITKLEQTSIYMEENSYKNNNY